MSSVDSAPNPQFAAAASELLQRLERLADDTDALELAALRLENMIGMQRQWLRRAIRRGDGPGAEALLERLESGLAQARRLHAAAIAKAPQGAP